MKTNSIWEENLINYNFNGLKEDIVCDVLIIGGGIAGILTAFYLKNSNLKIALVDRNKLLSGITSKMTAKVTILQDILTKIEKENLKPYLKSQLDGLNLLKKNIEDLQIECDFTKSDSYLFTKKDSNIKKIKEIEKVLEKFKINIEKENIPIKEIDSKYSIRTDSYVINPVLYLNKIIEEIKDISLYENTNIISVVKNKKTFISKTIDGYKIKSLKIVFATNYPYFLKPLFFPLKVRLERSYILYGNSNYHENFNLINIDKQIESIRFYKDKMIYLSENKNLSHLNNKKDIKILDNSFIKNPDNIWSNMDLITNDYLPIVGRVFQNMYIITGFNTWGLLSSHIGANMISSMITKKKSYLKYKDLFEPRKKISIQKILNSSINIYESMNGYFKGFITKNKYVFYSKDYAMYIGSNKKYYIVKRTCPHMKCKLIFNEIENTWDCPCHGSRFNLEGKVISGPSKFDIK